MFSAYLFQNRTQSFTTTLEKKGDKETGTNPFKDRVG